MSRPPAPSWPGTLPTVVSASPSRVAVFGAGYVGLVTGACFAELGHSVVVRDVIPERIAALQRGEVPIYEPGLEDLIGRNADRLRFTGDVGEAIDGADFVYVAVGTPPTYSGDADLSAVWTVIDELPAIDRRCVVVMKSTVPVGTGLKVRHRLDERGLHLVGYVSNPEFTAEGTAVEDFLHPDRIVIGAFGDEDGDAVAGLHAGIDAPVVRSDVASAEMIKLAANAALMTRISFINEIANVCEATGADVVRVAEGIGLDRRIGPSFLRAGIGFGGSCFPKDSLALKQLAANSRLPLPAAERSDRGERAAKAAGDREAPHTISGRCGTSASRCSGWRSSRTPTTCARRRASFSPAACSRKVRMWSAWDPIVDGHDLHGVEIADSPEAAARDADAVVVVTEWPQLSDVDWAAVGATMRTRVLIDGRNMLDPAMLRAAGFTVEGIGRAADPELPDGSDRPRRRQGRADGRLRRRAGPSRWSRSAASPCSRGRSGACVVPASIA